MNLSLAKSVGVNFRAGRTIKPTHTCDSTARSRKIPFIKPVCRSTVPVDQTTVFENFRKYYENSIKSVPISLFRHAPV